MTSTLDPLTVKRLAFIRFLYQQGLGQSRQPEPFSATALLSFHDAVELFLVLAGERLHANLPSQVPFPEYWDKLKPRLPAGASLSGKSAMVRMNKLRVNLKHYGAIPSSTDLEQLRADVTTFFIDSTKSLFGADFERLDLMDLIVHQGIRDLLQQAEEKAASNDYTEALALLSEAFNELLKDYAERKRISDRTTPYTFGADFTFGRHVSSKIAKIDWELGEFIRKVHETAVTMQQAMRVMAVGLDYRKYARFAMLIPDVRRYADGRRKVHPVPGLVVTDDDYHFCQEFVITAAVHLSEVDFDLDLDALERDHWLREQNESGNAS